MTEDEAKTKTCCGPKIVLLGLLITTGKKISDPTAPLQCAGSACMAWRWAQIPNPEYERQQSTLMSWSGPRPPISLRSDADGYCGLAGQP